MATAKVNGVELYYETAGQAGAPAIIFAHSIGSSIDIWDDVTSALSARFYTIRYDIRGHGRSSAFDAPVSIEDLAADQAGLLDALGIESAHVVGLSLGGMIAQAFALDHPGRVLSLGLVATTAHLPPPEFWRDRAALVRAKGMAAAVDLVIPRWFTEGYREREPAVVAGFHKRFVATDAESYARCCAAIGAMDLREQIAAIRAPTLVLVGSEDPATPPAMAEDLRQRIPGSELVVVSGAAHIVSVERADAVTAHLAAFIDRHERGAATGVFAKGLAVRTSVLGANYVEATLAKAGAFGAGWQDFITRYAWGEVWGDSTLPKKTRSLLTLAMMIALHREEEFKLHVRPALGNGVTVEELKAVIKQAAIYAGVPAGNAAMRWAREVLGKELG